MATFWTALGLSRLSPTEGAPAQIHNNIPGGATGAFGFLDSTWRAFAPQAGVDTSVFPRAANAPLSVQQSVAAITPITNWTCPGCNSAANVLAQDPANVTNLPGSGGPLPPEIAGSGPVGGDLSLGSSGLPAASPGFVSAPDGSGFSSGLPAGSVGAPASANADFPNIDLGNLSVGNLIPGGTASQGTGLSVSPDLSSGALGTQDVSGTGTFQNLGDTPTSIAANQAAQSKLIPNLWTDIVTFSQRAAVIVLGLVLIALAAAALVRHNTLLPAIGKGSRGI